MITQHKTWSTSSWLVNIQQFDGMRKTFFQRLSHPVRPFTLNLHPEERSWNSLYRGWRGHSKRTRALSEYVRQISHWTPFSWTLFYFYLHWFAVTYLTQLLLERVTYSWAVCEDIPFKFAVIIRVRPYQDKMIITEQEKGWLSRSIQMERKTHLTFYSAYMCSNELLLYFQRK